MYSACCRIQPLNLCSLPKELIKKSAYYNIHYIFHKGIIYGYQTVICELVNGNADTPHTPDINLINKNNLNSINFYGAYVLHTIKTLKSETNSAVNYIPSVLYIMTGRDILIP